MKLVHQLPLAIGGALLAASAAGVFGVAQMNSAAGTYERLSADRSLCAARPVQPL